ncbi:MAG TPA: flavohemoglobin expression-modulating QEGLA motif protein [Pseudomonadales bacterium]|nr:flavohemoglobin expression-modulating QEGLA motif protein [Pseudomonadales bacterium]
MDDARRQRIRGIAAALKAAEEPVRVLRGVEWPDTARDEFLAANCEQLPDIDYPDFDPTATLQAVDAIRADLDVDDPVDAWFDRTAAKVASGARLLHARKTADFLTHSRALFGTPKDPHPDGSANCLAMAQLFHRTIAGLSHVDLGAPPDACHLASGVAERMRVALAERLGKDAPAVEVVDHLSANALAGPRRIRLRRTACFTDRDYDQLLHHEAWVHVITAINGRNQKDLPILGASHPGTTRTQEGLAVFAEFVTGSMDLDRINRLADRVVAVQMAIDGADFIEVHRWFVANGAEPGQAFESARRVFRGGPITGGAPFTKDIVYLDGLLRVHCFLQAAVSHGRADCLRLLFTGKLDIEDVPALAILTEAGLCRGPKYLPPWAEDLRFLIAQLAWSSFLNVVDMQRVTLHYSDLLEATPKLESAAD